MTEYVKEWFKDHKFEKETLPKLSRVLEILEDVEQKNETVTLRQLNYRLTGFEFLSTDPEYKQLSRILKHARLAGLISWNVIEDHTRIVKLPNIFESVSDALETILAVFKINRQENQPTYVEVMVEKDTLTDVFYSVTSQYCIPLNVNKGNNSVTAFKKCAERLIEAYNRGQKLLLLYFGDFDPSGMEMVETTKKNLRLLNVPDCEVKFCGVTLEQAKYYNLRSLPIKASDKKGPKFRKLHGDECFEIDVLGNEVLRELVGNEIKNTIDLDIFDSVMDKEDEMKVNLVSTVRIHKEVWESANN